MSTAMSSSTVEASTFPTDDWDERTERFYTGEELDDPPAASSTALTPEERRRQEFGGVSVGAVFHGWLSALGVMALLGGLVVAAGLLLGLVQDPTSGARLTVGDTTALTVGLLGAGLAVVGAFSGSYAAGRLVRFDGGRQGVVVWILLIVSSFVAAGLAVVVDAQYALRARPSAPDLAVARDDLLLWGGVLVGATLVLSFLVALGGGKLGLRYHAKVERAGLEESAVDEPAAVRPVEADAQKPAKTPRRQAAREKRIAKKEKRAAKKEAKQDAKRQKSGV